MAEPVELKPATDIPGRLRELAQEIEDGNYPDCRFVVVVMADAGPRSDVQAWAFGQLSTFEAIGACAKAIVHLSDAKRLS